MEAVTTMLIQGRHPSTLAKDFAKKMNSKKFDAYRLLHTESSFLMSEATHAGYKEDGVENTRSLLHWTARPVTSVENWTIRCMRLGKR